MMATPYQKSVLGSAVIAFALFGSFALLLAFGVSRCAPCRPAIDFTQPVAEIPPAYHSP